MVRFLFRRLLSIIPVLAIVSIIVFLALRLGPGDPAAILAGDSATPEMVAAMRAHLGLDQSLPQQFLHWVVQIAHGDLGRSITSNQPVTTLVASRLQPTLALAIATIIFSILVATPLGVLAAWRRGTWVDNLASGGAVIGFALPAFVTGYLLVFVFALKLQWLPVQGFVPLSEGFWPFGRHLVLPTLTLSTIYIALITRVTRASMLEILGEDFVRTARAKGLPERVVLFRHALGNSAIPILSVIGIGIALLLGGVVVTESVFSIPGLGRLTVEAVVARDYPVVQGIIILFSGVYVLINLAVDISYAIFDPRISY
ncbi:ABC transporter permease [Bradyrhizobium manausense]|uniref:ABC transporter permease n=1 Tax=Bradyrhizobium manausense TaxID=989370 RepID=UPI001BA4676B|nr:ABC transporter permease [Bradyrhizobium manausense]MBR0725537.1 ABC transporter permease [Bradyrhizobium manausense]MBR0834200.1 ABC transporter permease [Bradyrhizobium manausense]